MPTVTDARVGIKQFARGLAGAGAVPATTRPPTVVPAAAELVLTGKAPVDAATILLVSYLGFFIHIRFCSKSLDTIIHAV